MCRVLTRILRDKLHVLSNGRAGAGGVQWHIAGCCWGAAKGSGQGENQAEDQLDALSSSVQRVLFYAAKMACEM
jgi:hypothetical protein